MMASAFATIRRLAPWLACAAISAAVTGGLLVLIDCAWRMYDGWPPSPGA